MPLATEEPTEIVIVEVPAPGAAIDVGLKVAVAPVGNPVAESATAELKLPLRVVVIVAVPELPVGTVKEAGEAEIAKSVGGGGAEVVVNAKSSTMKELLRLEFSVPTK